MHLSSLLAVVFVLQVSVVSQESNPDLRRIISDDAELSSVEIRPPRRSIRLGKYRLPLGVVPPPPVMDLMVVNEGEPLRRERLARWIAVIYERVYGRTRDDPRVALMVADIVDPVALH